MGLWRSVGLTATPLERIAVVVGPLMARALTRGRSGADALLAAVNPSRCRTIARWEEAPGSRDAGRVPVPT
jgi:hypothetical protein